MMNDVQLLLVEDDAQDISTCLDMVRLYNLESVCKINIIKAADVDEAKKKLNDSLKGLFPISIDGAIIDLKLADDSVAGNIISKEINNLLLKIPIIVFTGTPDSVDDSFSYIGVYKKGEKKYSDIFDEFVDIYNTGLTRIMGVRGELQQKLNEIFLGNLLPQINAWVDYGKGDAAKTEKALIRHTLNYLMNSLKDEDTKFLPEEFYLENPLNNSLSTGSIYQRDNTNYVVLNPACDLIDRNGSGMKTNRILLVEIEDSLKVLKRFEGKDDEKHRVEKSRLNSYSGFYHFLPETNSFPGGYIDFRKVHSAKIREHRKCYVDMKIIIAPLFIKDIISRFSSFYARQGQPEIEF